MAQSRAHTPADNCLHSLPISRRSKAPPGVGCVRNFGNDNTSQNCLCIFLAYMPCARSVFIACTDCAHELTIILYMVTDRQFF